MPWPLGDRKRGRVRQTVIGADDEGRERIALIEKGAGHLPPVLCACLLGSADAGVGRDARAAHPTGHRRVRRGRHETYVDGLPQKMLERRPYLRTELALEPLTRECVRYSDEEDVVLLGDDLRLLEPGVVLRTRESHLQLAESGGPQLLEVQRFPFSLLVHYRSPHARDAARTRGSPHRRERPLETALSWKPANYTPGKMTSRCAMLTYTNRHPLISVIALFPAGEGTRP